MAETRVYKRRRPERTDYYRVIESRLEELERIRPECFEQKYGYLRKEVVRAIYAFLDCGIPENGEQTIRPPPLTAQISPPALSQAEAVDYIPDVDLYVQDPIYPD